MCIASKPVFVVCCTRRVALKDFGQPSCGTVALLQGRPVTLNPNKQVYSKAVHAFFLGSAEVKKSHSSCDLGPRAEAVDARAVAKSNTCVGFSAEVRDFAQITFPDIDEVVVRWYYQGVAIKKRCLL